MIAQKTKALTVEWAWSRPHSQAEEMQGLLVRHLILPHDTGHRVKDHIMIQNEVLNEETTQETQFGI